MNYPIWIDTREPYVVHVPDLPGCFTQGDTIEEALEMAKQAILLYLEGEEGPMPKANEIKKHASNPQYSGGIWAVVSLTQADFSDRSVRLNISIPERSLNLIDQYAKNVGESRSSILVKGALELIRHGAK